MLNVKIILFLVLVTNPFFRCLALPNFSIPGPSDALNSLRSWYNRVTYPRLDLGHEPSVNLIAPGLYLGNAVAAQDPDILRALNITHILTIESRPLPKATFDDIRITTLFIKAHDTPKTNLLPYFPMSNAFIANGLRRGNVLVHCHYGVSRSATLVIAYLMETHSLSFEDAFEMVASKRDFINPNSGFVAQLKEYEDNNFDVGGVQRVSAYMAVQGRRYKVTLAAAACCVLVSAIIVPILTVCL